jgi:PQQ-like domain
MTTMGAALGSVLEEEVCTIAIARAPQLMLVLVAVASTSSPAAAWRTTLDGGIGFAHANAIVRDSAGQLIAGGVDGNQDFLVAKVDAASGTEIWRHSIDGSFPDYDDDEVFCVAVDAADDVIAGGVVDNVGGGKLVVAKLAAATGAEIWRQDYDFAGGSFGVGIAAVAVAVDSAGDVVALGQDGTSFVAKLDGATGVEVWHVELPGFGVTLTHASAARALAFDGAGNPIIGGSVAVPSPPSPTTIIWPC